MMKEFGEHAIEIFIYIVLPAVAIVIVGFIIGFSVGRATAPKPVVQYVDQPTPDREYLQRFKVAGENRYEYVLVKEWATDIEFVTEEWRR